MWADKNDEHQGVSTCRVSLVLSAVFLGPPRADSVVWRGLLSWVPAFDPVRVPAYPTRLEDPAEGNRSCWEFGTGRRIVLYAALAVAGPEQPAGFQGELGPTDLLLS